MMNTTNAEQQKSSRPAWSRAGVVLFIAFAALLVAYVTPVSEVVLDILWGFSFCLAGAAIMICFAAQNSSDLAGFVPVVSSLILLRLIVLTSTARQVVHGKSTGILINTIGNILVLNRPLGATLLCLLLAVVCVVIIFVSCEKIATASKNYINQVLPLKKIGLETDLHTGIINEANANILSERIVSECRFFNGMKSASLLMRSEAAICIFILLSCLTLPVLTELFDTVSGVEYLIQTAPAVLALSLFTLLPAFIVAKACGTLMSRETLALRIENEKEFIRPAKQIASAASETENKEEIDSCHDSSIMAEMHCVDASDYYETLCELICELDASPCVALLASDKRQLLPTTVAVNVAILLAQKQQNVLLVGADTQRNTIAQIFEVDPELIHQRVMPSCLEHLSVYNVAVEEIGTLQQETHIMSPFTTTLVYLPDATTLDIEASPKAIKPHVYYFATDFDDGLEKSVKKRFAFGQSLGFLPDIQSVLEREKDVSV